MIRRGLRGHCGARVGFSDAAIGCFGISFSTERLLIKRLSIYETYSFIVTVYQILRGILYSQVYQDYVDMGGVNNTFEVTALGSVGTLSESSEFWQELAQTPAIEIGLWSMQ